MSRVLEQSERQALLHALAGTTPGGPLPGRARLRSCSGPSAAAWMVAAPATPALRMSNDEFLCALRRRLGLGVAADASACEGCGRPVDVHGHHRAACTSTGPIHGRHRALVAAWRQVLLSAGAQVPQRNVERLLRDPHVPTDLSDNRRLDLVAPGLAVVGGGSPLFCDVTCVSPLTVGGAARSGTTLRDGGVLAAAHRENHRTYPEVGRSGLGR